MRLGSAAEAIVGGAVAIRPTTVSNDAAVDTTTRDARVGRSPLSMDSHHSLRRAG
jgi:hypothetical protein